MSPVDLKALAPIDVTLGGMTIEVSADASSNMPLAILGSCIPWSNETKARVLVFANARSPIDVTLAGT